jgi:hypothetical protein
VTCYPFHWIGSAPKRFIVQGHWVPGSSRLVDDEAPAPPARRSAPRGARSANVPKAGDPGASEPRAVSGLV